MVLSIMKPTFVYLLTEGQFGPVKIGIAQYLWQRLAELQLGNPRKLTIAKEWGPWDKRFAWNAERLAHAELKLFVIDEASEWFSCGVETAELAIEKAIQETPTKLAYMDANPWHKRNPKSRKFASKDAYWEYLRQMAKEGWRGPKLEPMRRATET